MDDDTLEIECGEWLRYGDSDDKSRNLIERLLMEVSELEIKDKRIEILEEQLRYARSLIDAIDAALRASGSAKQCVNAFNHECNESMFER